MRPPRQLHLLLFLVISGLLQLVSSPSWAFQLEVELIPGLPHQPIALPYGVDEEDIRVEVLAVDLDTTDEIPVMRTLNVGGIRVEVPLFPHDEPYWVQIHQVSSRPTLLLGARRFVRGGRVERVVLRVSTGGPNRVAPLPEEWPEMRLAPPRSLAIVTTGQIVEGSNMLETYVMWREAGGFTVFVGTEEDWDRPVTVGVDRRQERIRGWIRRLEEEHDIGYVLLIGDPDPANGEGVPMQETHPLTALIEQYAETFEGFVPLFEPVPTDHYYSDLLGDWDLDGDGLPGEYPDDDGEGGIRWAGDAVVGRIPVYDGQLGRLDSFLAATMAYERSSTASSYRHRVLLPAAFLGFVEQPRTVWGKYDETEDAASVAEFIRETVTTLDPLAQMVSFYEEVGVLPSSFEHELPLTTEDVISEWSQGAGLVVTFSHGGDREAYRSIWTADLNEDTLADEEEVIRETFLTSDDVEALIDASPAISFLGSCLNGRPEVGDNLGFSLLGFGSIATVASSRAAMGGSVVDFEPAPDLGDAYTMAYTFVHLLLEGVGVGEAVAYLKYGIPADGWNEDLGGYGWLGKLEFNLYGDPTLGLGLCVDDRDCDDGLPCNGVGRCVDGYCARGELVDCRALNSDCATSRCDPTTGECDRRHHPEGIRCDDGLFCTVDDVCEQGVCVGSAERPCELGDGGVESVCDEHFDECVEVNTPEPDAGEGGDLVGGCSCSTSRRTEMESIIVRLLGAL